MMGTGWMRAPIQPEPSMYRTVNVLPTDLSSQDLFRTNSRMNCDSVKGLTVRIFYNTGTILVQGNRCPRRREEFSPLIKCIRAVYAFVDRVKEPVSGICTTSACRLFGHRRVGSQDYRMLDPGAARVHSSPGQPEYEKELASTSGPQSQVSLPFGSSSLGFPAKHTDPTPGSLPCHTSYHTPPASLPSHTATNSIQKL